MRVLVLGSEGNIGRHLVPHLRVAGHTVYRADLKAGWVADYTNLDIACSMAPLRAKGLCPDVVVNLAAMVSRVTCEESAALAVRVNLLGLQNVLDYCRETGARLVYSSSSEVYGPTVGPMREDAILDPLNRYGLTKKLAEQLITYEVRVGQLDATVLRLFMVYGPDEDRGDHRSALVRFADGLTHGRPVTAHRDTWRSWLHVTDCCRAFEAAVHKGSHDTVNVGHPDLVNTVDLAYRVAGQLGADRALVRITDCPPDITPCKEPALDKQQDWLGFWPEIGLEEGIAELCREAQKWPA